MKKLLISLLFVGVMAAAAMATIQDSVNPVFSGKYLCAPNQAANQVLVWDTSTSPSTLKTTINLGGSPRGLAVNPKNDKEIFISTTLNGDLRKYNIETGSLVAYNNSTLNLPRQVAVSPDGALAYVVDAGAKRVYIYNAKASGAMSYQSTSIYVGVSNLYGISVSPDNTMLAVTERSLAGRVWVYNINRDAGGNITGYSLKATLSDSNLVYPAYVIFSAESDRLYVRTSQYASTIKNYDLIVFSGATFQTASPLSITNADERDPNNQWGETMAMSSNGQKLYLTHYRTGDQKVHAYNIATVNNDGTTRTNWNYQLGVLDYEMGSGISSKNVLMDGAVAVPNGSRVWFTNSENSTVKVYSKWTGFVDPNTGELVNPIPLAPTIVHPNPATDDMLNFNDPAVWSPNFDPSHPSLPGDVKRYQIDYMNVSSGGWISLDGFTPSTTRELNELLTGIPYLIRVKMNWQQPGQTVQVWGPFAYSQQFKKVAPPVINHIEINKVTTTSGFIFDTLDIYGSGFGMRDLSTQPGDSDEYNITFNYSISSPVGGKPMSYWYRIPMTETIGTTTYNRITIWDTTNGISHIQMQIPRKSKNGQNFWPRSDYKIIVTAHSMISDPLTNFKVGPVITKLDPAKGNNNSTVNVYGYGFNSTQSNSAINFGGVAATVSSWTSEANSDHITCTVPLVSGIVPVNVTVSTIPSNPNYPGTTSPVTFEVTGGAVKPVISKFQVKVSGNYQDTTEAIVYDTIKIVGTGFGADPGVGKYDTAINNVTIAGAGQKIRTGKVYSWKADGIEIGITRKVAGSFLNAGPAAIVVTSPGGSSDPKDLNLKPHIYGIDPQTASPSDSVKLNGTALEGTAKVINFDSTPANYASIVHENGTDPDGEGGNDVVTVAVPAIQPLPKTVQVTAVVNTLASNALPFNAVVAGAPVISSITPNAAPNSNNINGVVILGKNFKTNNPNPLAVTLKRNAETITGVTGSIESGKIVVDLPIKLKTVGKWDVEVKNGDGQTSTAVKGFTILDGNDPNSETSLIIDDFEGVAVPFPVNYNQQGGITLAMTSDKWEGDQAGQVTFTNVGDYRGYFGTLATEQDITNYSTITFMIKADAPSSANDNLKLQVTAKSADGLTIKNFAIPKPYITLNTLTAGYIKKTYQISQFVEVDGSGNEIPGAKLSDYKTRIIGYLVGIGGVDASAAPIKLDFVAAGGYTPPSPSSDVTTTIVRAGDTINDGVKLDWTFADPQKTGPVDIYKRVGTFSTNPPDWGTAAVTGVVGSTYTFTDPDSKVGSGKSVFYKVVKTNTPLTLTADIVGKYDITISQGMNLVSLPLIPTGSTALTAVIGSQLTGSPNGQQDESDEVWKYDPADPSYYKSSWLVKGATDPSLTQYNNKWLKPDGTDSDIAFEAGKGYWIWVKEGHTSFTWVYPKPY